MLKLFLSLLALISFCTGTVQAQGKLEKARTRSHYTYIYKVNNKEACKIYKDGPQAVNASQFHAPIDSFAVQEGFPKQLPQGHYLFMHSAGPELVYNLRTYSPIFVKLLQVKPALAVLVHDSLGNSIANAEVRLKGKKATYDPATQTYRLKRTPRKGLLSLSLNGFTLFEKLEKEEEYTYDQSFISKIASAPPIRFIWRPFYDVYNSVRWHGPQGWVRRVFSLFDSRYRRSFSSKYRGYLVTNKPMYQPGDTVMYKAFVVEEEGEPVNEKVALQLSSYGEEKKSLGEVQPFREGAYGGYFVLHDSLKLVLDKSYTLALLQPGKKEMTYIRGSFHYEDYELKENTYILSLKHKEHQAGQENSLILRGTNANGLNLLDARVEVALLTKSVVKSEAAVLFIPDTLWVYQQPLDAVGETVISIPDTVFPKASVDYTVTAAFLNASNERSSKTENASYHYTKGRLKLSLLQDSLLVQYLENGKIAPKEASVSAYNRDYDDLFSMRVQLPTLVPLNAYATGYEVTAGELDADVYLAEEEEPLVALQAYRTSDSLFFSLRNPRRLPYWYFVYRGEKMVARGQGNESSFFFRQPAKGEKPCFVAVHYMWAGEMYQLKEDAPHRKHLLTIDLQKPAVVYPGQQASMRIKVKDAAGKAVPGVDLTAYALTSKFKSQGVPDLPSWDRYKQQKASRKLVIEDSGVSGQKQMDWDYWGCRMGLDSMAYYNFLFPEDGLFTDYATVRDSITQVSPFVVDAGRIVPVHVVYLDEVPVYFSKTDVLPAYAFAADSGYHTIKLRTSDKLVTLDSVYLQHKRKFVVSADITEDDNPFAHEAEKNKLSAAEQQNLYRYLFYVEQQDRENTAYLKQGNRVHLLVKNNYNRLPHYFQRGQSLLAGPFSPSWMQYVRLNGFRTNFMMEPAYSYNFAPDLLKMREGKLPDRKIFIRSWEKWQQSELLHQEALTDRKIHENWEAAQYERLLGRVYASNDMHAGEKGMGRIGWDLPDSVRQQVKLVLLHEAGYPDSLLIYPRENSVLYNLKPAAYTLTLAFVNGAFATANVAVKPNGQTQIFFKHSDRVDSSAAGAYLLQLVETRVKQQRKADKDKEQEQQQMLQRAQETTFTYTDGAEQYSHLVTGVVTEKETSSPLPGVTVVLKGTKTGTLTDAGGNYRIYVPADGVLVFGFIGFAPWEESVNGRNRVSPVLEPDVKALQEVVVTGYGRQESRAVAASTVSVLNGKAAGVVVRGAATMNAESAKPLLVVDGVPFNGAQGDLDNILSTKVLKGDEATALYGAAGAAGVIIITTKKGGGLLASAAGTDALQQNSEALSIRNNFSDYAVWQPRLITNNQGEASFTVTFPDDVTSWNTYVLGMDDKKHSGLYSGNIKSFKAVMATLHLPRFLVEGDKAHIIGKASNYLPDSSIVTTRFEVGGKPVKEEKKLLNRNFTDTLHINAPAVAPDSVEVQYSLRQESGFTDGERRYLSVYPKGVEETTGQFLPLSTDTTFTLTFDPAKGPVRLHAQGELVQVMLDEIDYLHKYEYWCSEQAASKLIALLLEKRIQEKLGQPFAHDRMVRKLIRHLEKTQLQEGAWAWWQSGPAYAWITNHVVEALVMAKKESYPVRYEGQKLVDYMVYLLERGDYNNKLTSLETLFKLQVDVDFARYVKELEKNRKQTLEDKLRLMRMRQRLQLPVQLDTLQRYKKETMLGGIFWGEEKHNLFNNNISNTLLAYEILRAAGNNAQGLSQIQVYLLNERRAGHWRNTYESARVLETLLPELLLETPGTANLPTSNLSFSGPVNFESKAIVTDTVFAATRPLVVKKQGNLPLYFTAYQTTWNKVPQPVEKEFMVASSLKGTNGENVLQAGTPVEMVVEVEVKADADYVMIEVPVPASCSYDAKNGRDAYEVHREYFRNKVSIFCDRLPKGKHTFTLKLLPRYTGSYTLNPARAGLMYFPTFFGRNRMKQVVVR
ncbi:carboxypeptidase-like regulatory domain-containing protein [Pontibacter pamirensis]|uniref:carboxypeptidase-like regulatory domain-containing protein n=1 Tax=Pontibacter pamirensis TaxID=2562824 RepID=UPI00138A1E7F|nr:carboxypeptidase-like regulatory domain-containing protein [Pontibacter pamirensis]